MTTPSSQVPESARPVGGNGAPYAGANPWPNSAQAGQAYNYPAPAPLPGYSGYPGLSCRFCGSVPAEQATFRGHQGFFVIMRFLKLEGPFCRSCGIATHRRMTAKSLWQGWWGVASLVINPITMLLNVPQRAKINKLAPPRPDAASHPADPGRPVFLRAAILGLLVPAFVIFAIVYSVQHNPSYASVGDCVHNKNATTTGITDTHPNVVVIACSDPDADAKVVGKVKGSSDGETGCRPFSDADGYYSQEQGSDTFTLCLHMLKSNDRA